MVQVSDGLRREIDKLHPRQREAVLHPGNVVLRAGPGSGKTRTLAARAAYLLDTQVSSFRSVACITYMNSAAEEIGRRVARIGGVHTAGRLVCSTVHSFCMNEILRIFSAVTGEHTPQVGQVLDERGTQIILQHCFDEAGIAEILAQWRTATNTKIRRAIACSESLDEFDHREVVAAHLYEQKLLESGLIDFEAMVIRALNIVRRSEHVRDLLRARFPHLVVDEYQDLGGVLDALVVELRDMAGITVFAVGDTDQSILGFTGADAKYLAGLGARSDFLNIPLTVNYRSSQEIITLAEAALGMPRGRQAREGAPHGDVRIEKVGGGLEEHAKVAAEVVEEALEQGVPAERVAVLYPRKGVILDALLGELRRRALPIRFEKDDTLPKGSISDFVQRCASRAVTSYQLHKAKNREEIENILLRTDVPSLTSLEKELMRLRAEAEIPTHSGRFATLRALQQCLDPEPLCSVDSPAHPWLESLVHALDIENIAVRHPDQRNNDVVGKLLDLALHRQYALQDLARAVEVVGKVVLTNYHTSKGREFTTVVLPGLLNELIPYDVPQGNSWRKPNPKELAEQRRCFYVALTRAESTVVLITGPGYCTRNGYPRRSGPSSFVEEMLQKLTKV